MDIMKVLITMTALIPILFGIYFATFNDSDESSEIKDTNQGNLILGDNIEVIDDNQEVVDDKPTLSEMKTFVLTGENFKFVLDGRDNPNLVVKQGDTVRIEFQSTGGTHDWVLDEFSAATKTVSSGGGKTTVEFVADKKGTFEYYCSVGSHRSLGMKGAFVVQ